MKPTRFVVVAALVSGAALASHGSGRRDLGRLSAISSEQVSATVALKLRNADQIDATLASLYNRDSPQFRNFLSPSEFQQRFAPTSDAINKVSAALKASGLSVEVQHGTLLKVTGSPAAMEKAFNVELHQFVADDGTTFHAATGAHRLAPDIAAHVAGVLGLSTRPRYSPNLRRSPAAALSRLSGHQHGDNTPDTPDLPGAWTVADFAQYYNATPLYARGVTGKGTTIGIVTLAAFTPSDALQYWASLGLNADPGRIEVVTIDRKLNPSDRSGSEETTLDVEQSGGIAPDAHVIVYVAPNTDADFLAAWAKAVNDNRADAISTSWGEWEQFLVQGTPISDPDAAGQLEAFHNVFLQGALQGQSLSAAAGDAGSFDSNGEVPASFTDVLSVDHPAADTFILAAGGTTLPGIQTFTLDDGSPFSVNVKKERGWSWDYLDGLCAALGFDPVSCGIFPVGTGGGVSTVFPIPFFQAGVEGMRTTEPGQVLADTSTTPPTELLTLPSHFAGRNLPDVSFNADPETGYTIFYTSNRTGFGVDSFVGGTSFVAPQLAGVSALINQNAHGRVGLLSFPLYELQFTGRAYNGKNPPLRDIVEGDNEFYPAHNGYDQATGTGVMNIANFANLFR